ncbi:putative metal-dependent membrane protease [Sandaracinus amylolyticus]|uniref:Putative metal-dependent membrane protease n=1 Tax=Sandaracinus amylolyticus TaxID=927083 RepID=A0A0F6YJQ7_9BACT|nr:putative metal-dependent membrane protease [Sandaracinus amylolyticus]
MLARVSFLARAAWPIWNAEERRFRALVRLAIFAVLVLVVLFATSMLGSWLGGSLGARAVGFSAQVLGVIAVGAFCAWALDRRPIRDIGLSPRRGYLVDVLFGVVLGAICMGAIAGLELALGWGAYALRHETDDALVAAAPAFGSTLTVFVAVALIEEVVFRGYPVPNLREMLPRAVRPDVAITIAVVISSLVFGVAHAMNPNASVIATAYIAFGGLFLVLGLVVQGDLAIPIGAHLGWNLFQNLFGMQVSGQTWLDEGAILRRDELGPDVATGGAFGPEAGLEGLGAMMLGIVLTLAWLRVRGGPLRIHPTWVSGRVTVATSTRKTH